jgi:hypothetical protein
MNSADLTGFSSWCKWDRKVVSQAPQHPGVYAFRLAAGKSFGRFRGDSDVVYIGRSRTVSGRLCAHLSSGADIARRLRDHGKGEFEVAWKTVSSDQEAKLEEAVLLFLYYRDHGELPPDNHQNAGRVVKFVHDLVGPPPKDPETLFGRALADAETEGTRRILEIFRGILQRTVPRSLHEGDTEGTQKKPTC